MIAAVSSALAGLAVWVLLGSRRAPDRVAALRSDARVRRRPPARPALRRRHALAVAVLAGVIVLGVVPTALLAVAAVVAARWRAISAGRQHAATRSRQADVPDLVDLLVLTTGAGLTVPGSLPLAARWAPASLRGDLTQMQRSLSGGVPVLDALGGLEAAWGEPARPLLRALADHLRHGTPLAPGLERVGADARARRRRAAETRARRLPVLLLFPLVVCTLPAFGLLTVAPIVAGTLRSLDGERLEA